MSLFRLFFLHCCRSVFMFVFWFCRLKINISLVPHLRIVIFVTPFAKSCLIDIQRCSRINIRLVFKFPWNSFIVQSERVRRLSKQKTKSTIDCNSITCEYTAVPRGLSLKNFHVQHVCYHPFFLSSVNIKLYTFSFSIPSIQLSEQWPKFNPFVSELKFRPGIIYHPMLDSRKKGFR